MRSIKQIALTILLTVGAFSAITYTACNKDACSGVTCQNGGTCASGTCSCPIGTTGANCQIVESTAYAGTYKGSGTDNTGGQYSNFNVVFAPVTSNDISKFSLTLQDQNGVNIVVLSANYTSATGYTIPSQQINVGGTTYTYSGNGTANGSSASLVLTQVDPTSGSLTFTFSTLTKQ